MITLNLSKTIALLISAVVIAFGLNIPLYSDEVSILMSKGSFLQEDFKLLTLIPQCVPTVTLKMPIGWYPGAIFYSTIFYFKSALYLRILSLSIAIGFLGLFIAIVRYASWSDYIKYKYIVFSLSIIFLGTLPVTLILARPEQVLILALTFITFLAIYQKFLKLSKLYLLFEFLLLIVVTSIIFYTHPKGLFFLPLILACVFYTIGKYSKTLFLIATLIIFVITYDSVGSYQSIFGCEAAPQLSKIFAVHTTKLSLLKSNYYEFIEQVKYNLLQGPSMASDGFMRHIIFKEKFQSDWIAPVSYALPYIVNVVNNLIYYFLRSLVWFAIIVPPIVVFYNFIQRFRNFLDDYNLITIGLWIGLISHIALNRAWNFYTPIFPIVISILTIMLAFYNIRTQILYNKFFYNLIKLISLTYIFLLFILAVASASILYFNVLPASLRNVSFSNYDPLSQPLSTPFLGHSEGWGQVRELKQRCELSNSGRLVVDNLTYFYFSERRVLHIDFLDPGSFGVDIDRASLIPLLRKTGVTGIFVQCNHLPDFLQNIALKSGNSCCIRLEE